MNLGGSHPYCILTSLEEDLPKYQHGWRLCSKPSKHQSGRIHISILLLNESHTAVIALVFSKFEFE